MYEWYIIALARTVLLARRIVLNATTYADSEADLQANKNGLFFVRT